MTLEQEAAPDWDVAMSGRGLSTEEAAQRLAEHGPNVLRSSPPVPTWLRLLAQLRDPLTYLLLAAVTVSVVVWAFEGATGLPVDAVVISAIVLANAVLGYLQERRAEAAVAALQTMAAVSSVVLRDGVVLRRPSSELVVGDVLVLGEGDSVGADARLLVAASLRVGEASLTGESLPVEKSAVAVPVDRPLGERTDTVFKGTAVTQGTARAVVTATGMDTEMGRIAALLDETEQAPTPLQVEIAFVGRTLGVAVLVVAAVVMATVWLSNGVHTVTDAVTVLLLGVSLAVAAVPEGLPAILSVVLSIGVRRMADRHAIVKRLSSVETLGSASVICSDKTGTLTRNEMTLCRLATASGRLEVSGAGYGPVGAVTVDGAPLTDPDLLLEATLVVSGGALASNAILRPVAGGWEVVGDPTEAAFLVAEEKLGTRRRRRERFTRVAEVPFTSARKMMSTLELDHERQDRPVLVTKGAPDVLLKRCTGVRRGSAVVSMTVALRERLLEDVDELSGDALRTLGVAYRPLAREEVWPDPAHRGPTRSVPEGVAAGLEQDLVYAGTAGLLDPARTEAAAAVREARRAGVRVVMITGDHPATALRIAQDLALVRPGARALTGAQLEALDEDGLARAVSTTSVFARVSPEHKLRIVDAPQAGHQVVAMTGDGVNDAPALKSADIGVAMGLSGTKVAKEAATMILADDDFATIVVAVRQGRVLFETSRSSCAT